MNPGKLNKNYALLGDRVLSAWVGTALGGIIHLPTYTYTNLLGAGNSNLVQNVPHKHRHLNWHFVHFSYSRKLRQAKVVIKFLKDEETRIYKNVNHYLAEKFVVAVGTDAFSASVYNGKIGFLTVVLGQGAYDEANKFDKPVPFEEGK